uniref:Protein SMG8 n=1 Tax=Caenorhabditis tropicalis TaxID=1561998 RepID=A0A1I7ULB8_9PELO
MNIMTGVLRSSNKSNVEELADTMNSKIEKFPVMFKRAVCIHSSLQFIDLLMQNIMFSHGFSSVPVIPNTEDDSEIPSKTIDSFYKIRKEFREIFRSHHRNTVSEVAIFIGTCPVRSTFSYRVPIYVCESEDSSHNNCGETCAELNDTERRKINRDLFMHGAKDSQYKKKSNKNHRLFVFVKGSENMVNECVEEEEPPFGSSPCYQYSFIHDNCNCEGAPVLRENGKWLRIVPFIVHSKH